MKLSAVINTWNEEKNITRCLSSISALVDEIVVIDMGSTDQTVSKAKEHGARIYTHPYTSYVEPARNFAVEKAKEEWVLIIDADEEISPKLQQHIKRILDNPDGKTFFRLPRKNISFGKWIKYGMWWPDYQIRLFRKGYVEWQDNVHSMPITRGKGMDLPAKEEYAIIHHNYQSIEQFVERLNRYSTYQAKERLRSVNKFNWTDVVYSPSQEFLRRFFLAEGYKDGLHGLSLALLQAFSELVVVLKIWQGKNFPRLEAEKLKKKFPETVANQQKELNYWLRQKKFSIGIGDKLRAIFT